MNENELNKMINNLDGLIINKIIKYSEFIQKKSTFKIDFK